MAERPVSDMAVVHSECHKTALKLPTLLVLPALAVAPPPPRLGNRRCSQSTLSSSLLLLYLPHLSYRLHPILVFLQESDCPFQQRADLPPRQAPERLPMIRSSIYTGPRCTACVYSIYTPARCAPFPIMFPDSSVRTRRLHSLTQNRIPQLYRITDPLLRLQRSTFGFTSRDAARAIFSNRFRRSTVRIDTEPTGRVQGRDFVRRTLSWFMVPLMAVAILGSDHAVQYFPMLPLSIRGAQFSYQQAVLGIRLELESHTEMFAGDIMTDPRGEETLYFSQRLQTAVLDGLSIRMPSLYMAINSWIETRFQLEFSLTNSKPGVNIRLSQLLWLMVRESS